MASTFIERNKKKSLAALLLFLWRRKGASALVFLVLFASMMFLSPSSWLTRFPGGARAAAAVAWLADKMGMDMTRFGLGREKRSFAELEAAFAVARAGGSAPVGWGAFFARPADVAPTGARSSVDLVRGDRADLSGGAKSASGAADETISAVQDPAEAQAAGSNGHAVALTDADVAGERREGFLKSAFAGGFVAGLFGFGGADGKSGGPLSGGAFVKKGFFNGPAVVTATSAAQTLAHSGFSAAAAPAVPKSKIAGAAKGKLSSMRSIGVEARAARGAAGAKALSDTHQLTNLAEANAVDQSVTTQCPGCSGETQSSGEGAVYDGHGTGGDVLTAAGDPVPELPPDGGQTTADAAKLQECLQIMQTCEANKNGPIVRLGQLQNELADWFGQMGGACGDPCNCGPCNDLKNKINGVCGGELQTVMSQINQPCQLPSYCASLGVTPPSTPGQGGLQLCQQDPGKCGCNSFLCDLSCLF